jgi:hypothetical protein
LAKVKKGFEDTKLENKYKKLMCYVVYLMGVLPDRYDFDIDEELFSNYSKICKNLNLRNEVTKI